MSSSLVDAGLVPVYPFGATDGREGVPYYSTAQFSAVVWFT